MNNQRAVNQYQHVNTQTNVDDASPHQLIAMLINGALSRLATARGCIERKDYAGKGQQLGKAIDIISGLQSCLDMEAGGQISANLDALYDYSIRRLSETGRTNDVTIVDEVIGLLREIKSGWDNIPKEFHHNSSMSAKATVAL